MRVITAFSVLWPDVPSVTTKPEKMTVNNGRTNTDPPATTIGRWVAELM
jgi:hypothetical protein